MKNKKRAIVLINFGPKTLPEWFLGNTRVTECAGEWSIVVENVRRYNLNNHPKESAPTDLESFVDSTDIRFEGLTRLEVDGRHETYKSSQNATFISVTWW